MINHHHNTQMYLFSRNTSTGFGWRVKNLNITGGKDILLHQCRDMENVTDCIVQKTYGLAEVVGNAVMGRVSKISLMDPHFWIPDFSWPRDGLCYTLNYRGNIADSYARDDLRIFGKDPNKHQIIYIHDPTFFANSLNPQAFSMTRTKAMNATYMTRRLARVKHKLINRPGNTCEEVADYSFIACIKNSFSASVGCRLPWDRWSDQEKTMCTTMSQFRHFEKLYDSISNSATAGVEKVTGCKKPCQYYEYRTVGIGPTLSGRNSYTSYFGMLYVSTSTVMEVEMLAFPWTSLVAEFGGTLGLFLGLSFMNIWDGALFGTNSFNTWWNKKN